MKASGCIIFSTTLASLCLVFQIPLVYAQITSCTGDAPSYERASTGSCMSTWYDGGTFAYPDDFEGILNEVTIYTCPTSDKRVIISNGIPDHDVKQANPSSPCEIEWAVSIPLNPSKATENTETPASGIIAMALNGVPAYGALEGTNANAVEPTGFVQDAQFWYGHSDQFNAWHFHNPYLGQEDASSDTLLGYALDGFPIYGPLDDDSVLDSCNGRTDDSGNYKYHVRTTDQVDSTSDYCAGTNPEVNWNYVLGCYSGSTSDTSVESSSSFSLPDDCYVESEEDDEEDSDDEVECTQNGKDKFFFKYKDGVAKLKKCNWLKKKKVEKPKQVEKWCKNKVDSYDYYGPPGEVCPKTCYCD